MAKNSVFILFVLVTITWLMVTAQGKEPTSIMANRQPRHIFLFSQATSANDMPSFDFEYNPYNLPMEIPTEGFFASEGSDPRIPNRISRPVTLPSLYSGNSGTATGKTFGVFSNFFGNRNCPLCPQCPTLPIIPACPAAPSCPTCPVCPPSPTQAATTIALTPQPAECPTGNIGGATGSLSKCAKVSTATTGTIDVTFSADGQTVVIGIAAVLPNTQIELTCQTITATRAKTQENDLLVPAQKITTTGFVQLFATSTALGTATTRVLACTWKSIP